MNKDMMNAVAADINEDYKKFFEPLPQVVAELYGIFEQFGLSQRQASCAAACALHQLKEQIHEGSNDE
ncbi:hypothetical protein HMPREF0326_02259 [Desulfovibrio sp. 3_1_syn3]|mgnify:CR=1 FL=1|uniref:hypothetical protein n=1 Tax=Desulfovibrio sp. 3_1_syn3 TaxID=457398 RepID=UPI0001E12BFA|nr:hypothetical protein [Desulfovibrio sp. 3_1_syn3]EFL85507.1 hypothetical protein HMPREF0326_02259 [Desulfovibrio sp. 3_1_syn3]